MRRARAEGFGARMLPAVSAEDCLFADLGIDPGPRGLQAYEATYFFRTRPPVDPRATLLLLQVGMLCEHGGAATPVSEERFPELVELLRPNYGPGCEAVLFGHTHLPVVEEHDGVWLLNPGSPTERRRGPFHSMLVLEIEAGKIRPELVRLT